MKLCVTESDIMSSKNQVSLINHMHKTMVTIRLFEERVANLVANKEIKTPCHLYIGQEAVATGACAGLSDQDLVFSTHRSHGHYIAKGGSIKSLMAEIFTRQTGCSGGHGGSMHISAPEKGFPGSSAIVAGTISLAVGSALAFQLQNSKSVSIAFFGDGATNEGVFYECLNFAALKKLPIIFVCENNLYSTHLPIAECLANPEIHQVAKAFTIPSIRIYGNDVINVNQKISEAVERARAGEGPSFFECMTYRWRGHVGPNDDIDKGLRSREELDSWINQCPIKKLEQYMLESKNATDLEIQAVYTEIAERIDDALDFARNSSSPEMSYDEMGSAAFMRD